MLKSEAAAYLAGVTQTEGAEASAPTNLHVITGEVGEASADGKTLVKIDGLMFSESDDQFIEVDALGGLEEGDIATIVLTGEQGHAMTPLALGSIGSVDRITVRIAAIEADYIKVEQLDAAKARIGELEADHVSVDDFNAATGRIGTLETTRATITDLNAATARIGTLEADHVSTDDFSAATARIGTLETNTADIGTIRANSAKVQNLTAAEIEADHAKVGQLDVDQIAADHATIGTLDTTYATIANLNAANGRITNLESTKANISDLEADYITADEIEATYMHANMSNSDVAWIENGTIKNGAIVSAMINDVSANKLTAGTINGSVINVTNLNADNITTGTINGQRIGEGSLSLDKLSEDVYTEAEVDTIVDGLNDRIDGAIETFTGTAVPTLSNTPASSWNTAKLKDQHVGDVYYVVNNQSAQNGYCYRFTKSGSTYSWQLIKDSDVTAALSRLTTAEGKITTFDSDISKLKTDTGTLTTKTESLETRMSDAEADILDKVDITTFNEVSDTVDSHSQSITQMTTTLSNKADSSTVTAVTNRVSKNEQDISGINTTIGELQDTVETKADGSTVETVSNRLNTVSNTVDGHTQTLTSVQNTLSTKADSSTVSTLTTKVNNVSDTVDGHTSQLSSITTTQTTMQTALDKTVKSSIQLWYSKANTTAPNKPTSQVTSTSTNGNAWRIVVPAYNSSYPHYFYCWQYEYVDGTYGWSAVVRDIAMGESQSTARTADSNASAAVTTANTANTNASTALTTANTANTNASDAKTAAATASTNASEAKTTAETAASDASTAKTTAASAVTTANSASTTATNAQNTANANIKSSVQLWFTKANSTAPNKPTSVVSTSNANTTNAWNLVVPVWNKSYPHYYYCYQQQKGDGTYQWTDVVYDRATSEAQQLANTTSTNLSTLQTNYATFKQTTEQFESTVGTKLTTIESDIDGVEERVSSNETSISNNASAIALKANSSDVYTKTQTDGKITQEVTDRNAAITAKANEITSTVSQTYTTKTEFNNLEIGGRNLLLWSGDANHSPVTRWGSQNNVTSKSYDATYDAFKYVTPADSGNQNNGMGIYTLSDGWTNSYGRSQIVNGSSYVFSIDVMGTLSSGNPMTIKIFYSSSAGDWNATPKPAVDVTDKVKSDSFTRVSVTFTLPSTRTEGTRIVLSLGAKGATFYVKNPKLELGNKATAWTPAPEDTTDAIESAKSEIKVTTDTISSTVEKVSSVKYLVSSNNSTLANIKAWATEGHTDNWTVASGATGNLRVGDTVYLQYGDNTRGCKVYIKGTVNSFTNASVNFTSHGYEDVLPVDTIKSTINQSSDSVKIQAKHVEIDGTAVFSAISDDVDDAITSKGYQTSSQVNSAITSKGYATTTQAQGYATTAKSEAISAAATDATAKASNTLASAKSYADEIKQTVSDWVLDPMFSTGADKFAGVVLNATAPATLPSGCTSCGMLTTRDHASGIQHYGKAGHKLRVHYWCYCVPDSGSTVSPSRMGVGFLAPTANNYADVAKTSASGKWFEFSAVKIVPSNTTSGWAKLFIQQETASGTTNTGRWYITGLTVEDVTESAAAMDVANAAAPKANAVKRTQRIWYRTNGSSAPATPGTASSNWVTKADDGNDAWTKMHIAISSTHKYIYTCEQYEMANGTVGYTSVLLDNTITVIDGGNIITGSVTANKLNAANINASKTLTIGAFQQSTQDAISNDKVPQYRIFTTTYSYTLSKWLEYAADGYQDSWSQAKPVIVGDTVLIKGTASDTGEAVYLLATVDTVGASNQITKATSHGLIDPTAGQRADLIQVGGRNLLLGAATQDTSVGNSRESVNETNDTWLGCKVFRSSAAWADIGFRFDIQVVERGLVKAGDVLTYSIWAKTDDTTSRDIYGVWMSAKSGSAHMNGAKIATLTSEWTRYEKQITVTQAMLNTATVGMATRFECNTNCTSGKYIYWAAPKLEKGNKATDWTPAPEDQTAYVDKSINDIDIGGRNLLRRSYYQQTTTAYGITCTNNGDGSVTINGTTTETPSVYLFNDSSASSRGHVTLEAGTYTLSGCPDGGSDSTWRLDIYGIPTSSGTTAAVDYGEGVTFTTTGGAPTLIRIRFPSGITLNNFTVWPKLERGNKATDWTPAPEDQTEYADSIAYQSAQPNLSPFFSISKDDVYNASTNPSGYWKTFSSNYITILDDGWAHVSASNTGSSYVFCNYFTAKDAVPESFKTSTNYTFLVETRNVTRSGSIAIIATSHFANELHAFTASPAFNVTGAESRYLSVTSTSDISSIACFTRGYVQVAAGASIEMDFRISIYEGEYSGPYKPYSGDTLFATNTALAGTNESLEGAITDIGELSDQLVGTVTEQNKTITDIQKYLNSLRQDLDAEIQSRQQWLNFNSAEGLIIGATGSTFKTVTTNTSQQFRSGGTVLAETSGTEFVAPVMRSDQILIGNWMWTRRDNGNLSLKWIG